MIKGRWLSTSIILLVSLCFITGCTDNKNTPDPEGSLTMTETIQREYAPVQEGQPLIYFTATADQIPEYDCTLENNFFIPSRCSENEYFESWYCHLSKPFRYSQAGNIFLSCTDPQEMNQGNHYNAYAIDEETIVQLDKTVFSQIYNIYGDTLQVGFEYAEYNGEFAITYVAPNNEEPLDFRIYNSNIAQCLAIFQIDLGDGREIDYPVFMSLETGRITDFLSNIDQERIFHILEDGIQVIDFNERNCLLVQTNSGKFYYIDAMDGHVMDLYVLSGRAVEDCTLLPTEIVCWDSDRTTNTNLWSIDLESFEVCTLLSNTDTVLTSGIKEQPCSFAAYRADNGAIHILDFLSNETYVLTETAEQYIDWSNCYYSPDGRKICTYTHDEDGKIQIYVFDSDKKQLLSIRRTNPNSVEECFLGWGNENEIIIGSSTSQDFYIYKIE